MIRAPCRLENLRLPEPDPPITCAIPEADRPAPERTARRTTLTSEIDPENSRGRLPGLIPVASADSGAR
jgi:hypothetical protein